jgi:LacI family transcriptional regulator, repressor for deo operon, udp, cdd, tsx, nupC, and nupG
MTTGKGVKVTVRDVARAANVSIGTVSRALKGQPGLSAQTRAEVLNTAQALGYQVRRSREGKPRRILFVYSRSITAPASNQFYSHVLHGAENACRQAGVSLSLLSVSAKDDIAQHLRRQEADAVLVMGYLDLHLMHAIRACGSPMALMLDWYSDIPCVNDDGVTGAWLATRHLLDGGARRPALLNGPLLHHAMAQRARGFRKALYERGLPADPSLEEALDLRIDYAQAAREAMGRLLALPEPPDAVFACNDATAISAMGVCVEAGLRIPDDIRFIGYDDIAAAALHRPALSTVRVDKEAIGHRAAMTLIEGRTESTEVLMPVRLVLRESSEARRG